MRRHKISSAANVFVCSILAAQRRALWEASEIAGWDLDALDGKLLEKIVNRVFREVKTRSCKIPSRAVWSCGRF